jgi:putative AdoMet-dependent methyltransferase
MDIDFYGDFVNAVQEARGPAWRYNEMKSCGTNFHSFFVARRYDRYHQTFRDYRREAERIVAVLGLGHGATVLDMGCGTGAFAIHAAPYYRKIYAVDVARAMLGRARRKAKKAGLANIEFHRGGFLTYQHAGDPVDAIVSTVALHHLPDFWKLVGLHRLASMVKPGGRLYLFDVVFSFDIGRYEQSLEQYIQRMSAGTGPDGRKAVETHIRDEHSTCGWIMEGLLERAGFRIDENDYPNDFLASYLCTRKPVPASGGVPAAVCCDERDRETSPSPRLRWDTRESRP